MNVANINDQFLKTYENVILSNRLTNQTKLSGILCLNQTHLLFTSTNAKIEIKVYYSWISSIDKLPLSTDGSPFIIKCKNFLSCTFIIQNEKDCLDLVVMLGKSSKPTSLSELCCFLSNEHLNYLKDSKLSDKIFDLESEYARMGVPNMEWTITNLNLNYQICDTYPSRLYVPSSASDQILLGSASFRSRGRLAVLSYLNRNGASICRCSQPLAGFSARCLEDEQLLDCILKTNKNASYMYVVDTRPKINAMANKATGKGFENENYYANIQFYFFGIENIHVMRSSLQKLIETCEAPNLTISQFLSGIEKSEWLKHIKLIIETAYFIAEAVNDYGVNVLVHCSDGWDRTAQTCALSELLIDPYYRTIHGFQILIEKEWLMFGHKFSERCGHTDHDSKEVSPIFTQFLDCIFQLQQQFPCAFEFNELFLLEIHDHVYSCQFGTFIGNCEKERNSLGLKEKTTSLWDYIQFNIQKYLNPIYKPNSSFSNDVLRPDTKLSGIKLWKRLYCRHDLSIQTKDYDLNQIMMIKDRTMYLEDYIKSLEKLLTESKSIVPLEKLNLNENDESNNSQKDINLVEWKSMRSMLACACPNSFDSLQLKRNCWQCGNLFCNTCVNFFMPLANHSSARSVFICLTCRRINGNNKQIDHNSIIPSNQFSINNSDLNS